MTGYQEANVGEVINKLVEENRKLANRIEKLEENWLKISNVNISLESDIKDLKEQLQNVDDAYDMWEQDQLSGSTQENVPNGYKCKGWVFYANEDDCNCLYKIKENGTCNTKLTDYSVSDCYILWSYDSGYIIVHLERPRNGKYEERFPV